MIYLLIAASTMFVYYDTTKNNIGKIPGEKCFYNLSPSNWSLVVAFLWIVAFPLYLMKRKELLEKAKNNPVITPSKTKRLALCIQGTFAILIVLSLMYGGYANNVTLVKGGTLAIDEAVTVGDAFDNYTYFSETSWDSLETKNGRKVVQVSGSFDLDKHPQAVTFLENGILAIDLLLQFSINKDGKTFNLSYGEMSMTGTTGEVKNMPLNTIELTSSLKSIYANKAL